MTMQTAAVIWLMCLVVWLAIDDRRLRVRLAKNERNHREYRRTIRTRLTELDRWCATQPVVVAACDWLRRWSDFADGQPDSHPEDISDFRARLAAIREEQDKDAVKITPEWWWDEANERLIEMFRWHGVTHVGIDHTPLDTFFRKHDQAQCVSSILSWMKTPEFQAGANTEQTQP